MSIDAFPLVGTVYEVYRSSKQVASSSYLFALLMTHGHYRHNYYHYTAPHTLPTLLRLKPCSELQEYSVQVALHRKTVKRPSLKMSNMASNAILFTILLTRPTKLDLSHISESISD